MVELPFIDFLVPLLNSALVFGVLGFAYFQTFFHKPKENLPKGELKQLNCLLAKEYAVGYKVSIGKYQVVPLEGYEAATVLGGRICAVKVALVVFFLVVWLYFSSVLQTFRIGIGIGSVTFEQCTVPDEKLQIMQNNILVALLYEEGLKQLRDVSTSLDKLERQLDVVQE